MSLPKLPHMQYALNDRIMQSFVVRVVKSADFLCSFFTN